MEFSDYFKFLLALLFVLSLIGLATVLLRYLGFGGAMRLGRRLRGEARRIDIVEIAAVDARRRLLLVRRDDREHLLLLGVNNDLVIETGITVGGSPVATADRTDVADNDTGVPGQGFANVIATLRGDDRG